MLGTVGVHWRSGEAEPWLGCAQQLPALRPAPRLHREAKLAEILRAKDWVTALPAVTWIWAPSQSAQVWPHPRTLSANSRRSRSDF